MSRSDWLVHREFVVVDFEAVTPKDSPDLPDRLANTRFLDTLRLARALLPYGRHNLDELAAEFAIKVPPGRNRALADALLTCDVF